MVTLKENNMKFIIETDIINEIPAECHECPFQLKFKDDKQNGWYLRRCVLAQRVIEYPKPDWCPIKEIVDK